MNKAKHLEMWKTLFGLLRQHVEKRVILFMGGYAAKYGYCQAYNDNMKIIRRWIREIGRLEVRTDFELVENWPQQTSCTSMLHPALAKYWKKLLVPNTIELKEAPLPRKRCLKAFSENIFTLDGLPKSGGPSSNKNACLYCWIKHHLSMSLLLGTCLFVFVRESWKRLEDWGIQNNNPEEWVELDCRGHLKWWFRKGIPPKIPFSG